MLKFATKNLANVDTNKFECERDNIKVLPENDKVICYVKTNSNGKYEFNNVAYQKYQLSAYYNQDKSILIFTNPEQITADLTKHDNLAVSERFQLNSVSLKSKALIVDNSQKGNEELGFENAQLYINDIEVKEEKSDKEGIFSLNQLQHGVNYKITLKYPHVYFEEKQISIDLSQKSIESLNNLKDLLKFNVKSFDVCGKIKFKQEIKPNDLSRIKKILRLKVYQQIPPKNEEINVKHVNLDDNLSYCFKLNKSPMSYTIKIVIQKSDDAGFGSDDDLSSYLKFVPDEKQINLNKQPILDLNFEQFDAELTGIVEFSSDVNFKCPTNDDNKFILYLNSAFKINFSKQINSFKCNQEKKSFEFEIKNVLFGQYTIKTNYDHVYCWQLNESNDGNLILNINQDKQKLILKQVAYKLEYEFQNLNVDLKVYQKQQPSKTNTLLYERQIKSEIDLKGSFCIKQLSSELIIEQQSCHLLNVTLRNGNQIPSINQNQYSLKLNELLDFTNNQFFNYIKFTPSKNQLNIKINLDLNVNEDPNRLSNDYSEIVINVYELTQPLANVEDETINEFTKNNEPTQKLIIKSPKIITSTSKKFLLFETTNWYHLNRIYLFKPQSKKFLFKPSALMYIINLNKNNDCNLNSIEFNAKLGLFIRGNISPATIDGIEVIIRKSTGEDEQQQQLVYQDMTDATQGFYFGPFNSDQLGDSNADLLDFYKIELIKPGYLFKKISQTYSNGDYIVNYQGDKLGELKIVVYESLTRLNLDSVLVSLSSSNKLYRKIIKTDINGTALFDNLEPDTYYLLVMMQEYEFKPSSQVIDVKNGLKLTIGIDAKRVAYSCLGKINTINGLPEGDIIVEAIGYDSFNENANSGNNINCKQSQENTKSDPETGSYRIRGLKPNCKYEIRIKHDNEMANRKLIPQKYDVEVKSNDINDVNFILMENFTQTSEISIKFALFSSKSIEYESNAVNSYFNNFIKLKLFKLNQPDLAIQTFFVPVNTVIYLNRLIRDNQHYLLQCDLLAATSIQNPLLSSSNSKSLSQQNQQQQQAYQQAPTIDKQEIIFQTDKLFKHLNVKFDLDQKKIPTGGGSNFFYLNEQQQYQNIYFTLPLFLIVFTLIYFKLNELIDFFKRIRAKLEQNQAFAKAINSVLPASFAIKTNIVNSQTKLNRQSANRQYKQNNTNNNNINVNDNSIQSSNVPVFNNNESKTALFDKTSSDSANTSLDSIDVATLTANTNDILDLNQANSRKVRFRKA